MGSTESQPKKKTPPKNESLAEIRKKETLAAVQASLDRLNRLISTASMPPGQQSAKSGEISTKMDEAPKSDIQKDELRASIKTIDAILLEIDWLPEKTLEIGAMEHQRDVCYDPAHGSGTTIRELWFGPPYNVSINDAPTDLFFVSPPKLDIILNRNKPRNEKTGYSVPIDGAVYEKYPLTEKKVSKSWFRRCIALRRSQILIDIEQAALAPLFPQPP